jgi:hypothetical protein
MGLQKIIDRGEELKNIRLFHEHGLGSPLFATFENGYLYGYFEGVALDAPQLQHEAIFPLIAAK